MRSEIHDAFGGTDELINGGSDRRQEPREVETGTTVVAVAGDEGAVMAADRRASLGGRLVTNRSVRKVEPVAERAAVAFSGGVGDAQAFVRRLRTQRRHYEQRHGEASVEALATVAGRLVVETELRVDLLLGGVREGGDSAVYHVDPAGGVLATEYAAAGSGTQLAYGALEGRVDPDGSIEDLEETTVGAVRAATERDTASGDGVTVARISAAGVSIEEVA